MQQKAHHRKSILNKHVALYSVLELDVADNRNEDVSPVGKVCASANAHYLSEDQ